MSINFYTGSTNTSLFFDQDEENVFIGQNMDPVTLLYNYLFNENVTLKDRNVYLLTYFQDHITNDNTGILRRTMSETNTFFELHVSFLKAMLMMTEHVAAVQDLRVPILNTYNQRKGNN